MDQLNWPSQRNRKCNENKKPLFRQWFSFSHNKLRNDCTIKTLHNDYGAHRLATTVSTTHHGRDEARFLLLFGESTANRTMAFYQRFRTECIDNEFQLCQIFLYFVFRSLFFQLVETNKNSTCATHTKAKNPAGNYCFFFGLKINFLPSRSATTFSWFPSDSLRRIFHCDGDRFCTKRKPKRIRERERARRHSIMMLLFVVLFGWCCCCCCRRW